MGYTRTTWTDRVVQYPRRYTDELGATKTFTPNEGTVTAVGTPITAAAMNNIESCLAILGNAYTTANATANAYTITIPNIASLTDGLTIKVKFNAASSAALTLNINSLGAKAVVDYFGDAVTNVRANLIADLVYDSVNGNFQLQGKGGGVSKLPNLVKNGGFENSSNCWFLEASNGGTMGINTGGKFGNYSLSLIGSASGSEIYAGQTIPYIQGHKYYVSAWIFSTIAGSVNQLYFPEITPYPSNSITCTLASTWYQNSFISSNATIVSGNYCFRMDNNNVNTTNNMLFDGAMCIDLTDAYGAGKEPSKATMDALVNSLGGWWDSDLSVLTSDATAVATQILSGTSGYIKGVRIDGSMTDYSTTDLAPSSAVKSGLNDGRFYVHPTSGYYTPSSIVNIWDSGYYAQNIVSGNSIMGLAGTATGINPIAGDTVFYTDTTENSVVQSATPTVKYKKITMNYSGTVRIKFNVKTNLSTYPSYGRIYKNGVAFGTLRTNSTTSYIEYSEDFSCAIGDYFQLYIWGGGGYTVYTAEIIASLSNLTTLQYSLA